MPKLSRPIWFSIFAISLYLAFLFIATVYSWYAVYTTFAYYGIGWREGLPAAFRALGPRVALLFTVFFVSTVVLVGQVRGKRWAFWPAVGVHTLIALPYAILLLSGGPWDFVSAIAIMVFLINLIAAILLVARRRTAEQDLEQVDEPPSPPATFE